jgi:hypothetical protein
MAELVGSCLCGGVRFEVTEPFLMLSYCHCTNCKKLSGGGGTANGRARTAAIRVLEGESLLRTYQPSEGSNLFGGGWPESEQASVRLSAIDSRIDQKPELHNYVRSLASWEVLPDDGLERYEVRRP